MFNLLGRLAAYHPWKIVVGWLLAAVAAAVWAPHWDSRAHDDDVRFLPDRCRSVRAHMLMEKAFPKEVDASQAIFVLERKNEKLRPADFARIRNVAQLRFDSELAPYAYQGYLQRQHDGTYRILRLPAEDSPLAERLQQVRERDYALLDTLDDQYRLSAEKISDSYVNWRRSNYAELEQEADLKHSARMRMLLGAAAVIGGIAAATDSSSTAATQVAGSIGVMAGIQAFKSGMGQNAEAKAHAESIKQQIESFSAEVAPMNVDLEGKVVELKGSGEQQFLEWRRLLKELYQNETGLGDPGAANAPAKP